MLRSVYNWGIVAPFCSRPSNHLTLFCLTLCRLRAPRISLSLKVTRSYSKLLEDHELYRQDLNLFNKLSTKVCYFEQIAWVWHRDSFFGTNLNFWVTALYSSESLAHLCQRGSLALHNQRLIAECIPQLCTLGNPLMKLFPIERITSSFPNFAFFSSKMLQDSF